MVTHNRRNEILFRNKFEYKEDVALICNIFEVWQHKEDKELYCLVHNEDYENSEVNSIYFFQLRFTEVLEDDAEFLDNIAGLQWKTEEELIMLLSMVECRTTEEYESYKELLED